MKYTFKTIVATEETRAAFTKLRDELNSSDKELLQAFWNFGCANMESIEAEVTSLKEQDALQRLAKKEMRAAEKEVQLLAAKKLAEKEQKAAAKAAKKAKKVEATETEPECVVVDGTL